MDLLSIGWLAGIYEGEGSVTLDLRPRKSDGVPRANISVLVTMTDEDTVNRLRAVTGLGTVRYIKPQREGNKDAWRWQINGKDAASFLMTILPLLSQRRFERAKEALLAWRSVPKYSPRGVAAAA